MKFKSEKEIIDSLINKYLHKEDNILNANRLFVAVSVVRWVFATTKKSEEILGYLLQIEKFLEGEFDLYWHDGIIKMRKTKKE